MNAVFSTQQIGGDAVYSSMFFSGAGEGTGVSVGTGAGGEAVAGYLASASGGVGIVVAFGSGGGALGLVAGQASALGGIGVSTLLGLGGEPVGGTGGFSGSLSDTDIARIVVAVMAALNATTGARTLGQHLQIQTAVLAGVESGAGTTHISFTDSSVVVEADVPLPGQVGNRTNVVISGV